MNRWFTAVLDSWLFALLGDALKGIGWLALGLFCIFLFVMTVMGGINLVTSMAHAIGIGT